MLAVWHTLLGVSLGSGNGEEWLVHAVIHSACYSRSSQGTELQREQTRIIAVVNYFFNLQVPNIALE